MEWWKRGPVIGRGSSATVHLATTISNHHFAVKSAALSSSTSLQKEQQILSQLNSPNIISYIAHNITYNTKNPTFNLFMEFAQFGTIRDIINTQNGPLQESLIKSYVRQILIGLDHIHSKNIVHCDIKCENILVSDNNCVKIGDMGCAKFAGNNGDKDGICSGTPVFMAPEVARGEKQGFESDVWSVGCVVIEMATGLNPWPEISDLVSGLFKIGFSGKVPAVPAWVSPECGDFLKKCLRFNGEERWSVKKLLGHPFVSGFEKVEEFRKKSPTSVLNHDFWGDLEVPATLPAMIFSGESPVERFRQLVGGSCLRLPDWINDNSWILVRSKDSDLIESTRSETTHTELFSFSNFYSDVNLKICKECGTELASTRLTCTELSCILNFDIKESLRIGKDYDIELTCTESFLLLYFYLDVIKGVNKSILFANYSNWIRKKLVSSRA